MSQALSWGWHRDIPGCPLNYVPRALLKIYWELKDFQSPQDVVSSCAQREYTDTPRMQTPTLPACMVCRLTLVYTQCTTPCDCRVKPGSAALATHPPIHIHIKEINADLGKPSDTGRTTTGTDLPKSLVQMARRTSVSLQGRQGAEEKEQGDNTAQTALLSHLSSPILTQPNTKGLTPWPTCEGAWLKGIKSW